MISLGRLCKIIDCSEVQRRTHRLGIVVLADVAGLLNVGRDLPKLADADILEVHNCATSLYKLAPLVGAHWQSFSLELFVLDHKLLQLTFGCSDLVQSLDVELTELLNVEGSTVLNRFAIAMSQGCSFSVKMIEM